VVWICVCPGGFESVLNPGRPKGLPLTSTEAEVRAEGSWGLMSK
jgi:hypothetical protein